MNIRRAETKDIPRLHQLLDQVLAVHNQGRPDLFKAGTRKYTDAQLEQLLAQPELRPIFVAEDEAGFVQGYAFCEHICHEDSNILTPIRTLYIDDLCVDANCRGGGVGKALYHYVLEYARAGGYYNVTLNVWSCNTSAMTFYEKMGLKPQKVGMETIL